MMLLTVLEARLGPYLRSRKKPAQIDPVGLALSHSKKQDFYPPFTVHAARIPTLAPLPLVSEPQTLHPTEVLPPADMPHALVAHAEPTKPTQTLPLWKGNMYDKLLQDGTKKWHAGSVSLEELAHTPAFSTPPSRRNRFYSLLSDPLTDTPTIPVQSERRAASNTSYANLLGVTPQKETPSMFAMYFKHAYERARSIATQTAQTLVGRLTGALYAFDYARRGTYAQQTYSESTHAHPLEATATYTQTEPSQPSRTRTAPVTSQNPSQTAAYLDTLRQSRERLAQERAERMKLLQKQSYAPALAKPKTERYHTPSTYNEPFTKPRVPAELFEKKKVHGVTYQFAKNVSYVPKNAPVQEPVTVYAPATLRTRPSMSIQEQIKNRRAGTAYTPRTNASYTESYSRAA